MFGETQLQIPSPPWKRAVSDLGPVTVSAEPTSHNCWEDKREERIIQDTVLWDKAGYKYINKIINDLKES